jgi:drug/metabolite transporter (DMT)-like permease
VEALTLLAAMVGVGVVWIAPFYGWELAQGARLRLDAVTAGSLAYVAVFPSVVAYLFWNQGVEVIGPNRAGVFIHLLPAFGAVLAALLLGESFRLFHLAGIGLILAGVALASAPRRSAVPANR